MSAEPVRMAPVSPASRTSRIECALNSDSRLIVALGAVFAHAAKRAGLSESAQEGMATAIVEAARETLAAAKNKGASASTSKIVVEEFSDRVEVMIETLGGAKPEGLRKRLEAHAPDRVRCEGRDGQLRVTLLKPCGAAKSSSTT